MREVLIVGGTSGIGRAIAEAFAAQGSRVTVTGLADEDVRQADRAPLKAVQLDVTSAEQVEALLRALHSSTCSSIRPARSAAARNTRRQRSLKRANETRRARRSRRQNAVGSHR